MFVPGTLFNEVFLQRVTDLASTSKRVIHLPSGAVGGLDLIQNAQALDGVSEVSLTTRKPAHTLIDETKVAIIADPTIEKNTHQVNLSGAFGETSVTIKNNPLPENPKTSYLAAMSVLGTLKRMKQVVQIG